MQTIILDVSTIFVVVQPVWASPKVFSGGDKAAASLMLLLSQPAAFTQFWRRGAQEGPRLPAWSARSTAGAQGRQPVLSALQRRHHLSRKWRLFSVSSSLILEHLNENIKCFPLREFLVYYWSFTSSALGLSDRPDHCVVTVSVCPRVACPENLSCALMAARAQRSPSLRSRGTEPLIMHKPLGQGFVND